MPNAMSLPQSLALPSQQALRVLVNVDLQRTAFLCEGVRRVTDNRDGRTSDGPGCGRALAAVRLRNAQVQYKMTTGVLDLALGNAAAPKGPVRAELA